MERFDGLFAAVFPPHRWDPSNSMLFLLFLSLPPLSPPSHQKQPLSSKAAERLDLELASGSTVADLYEAAEKRLGEWRTVLIVEIDVFSAPSVSSSHRLSHPRPPPPRNHLATTKRNSPGVPRGSFRLATASRTLLLPSAAPLEEEDEAAYAPSSSSSSPSPSPSSAAPAAVLFAFASPSVLSLRGGMMIKVKTLTGKEVEVDIEPSDTVARIKERVEEKEGIPPAQQRLIFAGKQMADEKQARDYNMEGGSVLHLVLALRGGSGAC